MEKILGYRTPPLFSLSLDPVTGKLDPLAIVLRECRLRGTWPVLAVATTILATGVGARAGRLTKGLRSRSKSRRERGHMRIVQVEQVIEAQQRTRHANRSRTGWTRKTRARICHSGFSLGSLLPLLRSANEHSQLGPQGLGCGWCNLILGRLSGARFATPHNCTKRLLSMFRVLGVQQIPLDFRERCCA